MDPTFAALSQAFLQCVRRRQIAAAIVKGAFGASVESIKREWQLDSVETQSFHSEHDCGKVLDLQGSKPMFAGCVTATV